MTTQIDTTLDSFPREQKPTRSKRFVTYILQAERTTPPSIPTNLTSFQRRVMGLPAAKRSAVASATSTALTGGIQTAKRDGVPCRHVNRNRLSAGIVRCWDCKREKGHGAWPLSLFWRQPETATPLRTVSRAHSNQYAKASEPIQPRPIEANQPAMCIRAFRIEATA